MPDIKIRNIPPRTMKFLRSEAKKHGHSVSEEVRQTLIRKLRDPLYLAGYELGEDGYLHRQVGGEAFMRGRRA